MSRIKFKTRKIMAQFKRIWLPFDVDGKIKKGSGFVETNYNPTDYEGTKKADAEIQKFITQGYKIVSTAPITKSYNIVTTAGASYANYTSGIEVFMVKE